MALQGTLSEFGVAEILQLLGNQRKTGRLSLSPEKSGNRVTIHFIGGQIVRVDVERRAQRMLIGEMLFRSGQLSRNELDSALKIHKKTLRRLGDVLVDEGLLGNDAVQKAVDLQANEVLYQLFEWREGKYHFEPADGVGEAVITPLSPESVLLEGFKLLDEWPLIRARVNNYRVVFRAVHGPADLGASTGVKNLSTKEVQILGLVDASRNVNEIIDISGLGEFETCKALAALMTRGHIKAVTIKGAVSDPRGHNQRRFLDTVGSSFWNIAILCVAVFSLWLNVQSPPSSDNYSSLLDTFVHDGTRHRLERVRAALEISKTMSGKYPSSLAELADLGLLSTGLVDRLRDDGVEYTSVGTRYVLRRGDSSKNG